MVPKASAVVPDVADAEPIVIHADHRDMAKFTSKEDNDYVSVSGHLQIMAGSAGDVIASRWGEEQRALKGRAKAWGPAHSSTLDTVNNLGLLYADLGRLEEAEVMYQRALKGYEKALGREAVRSTYQRLAQLRIWLI